MLMEAWRVLVKARDFIRKQRIQKEIDQFQGDDPIGHAKDEGKDF